MPTSVTKTYIACQNQSLADSSSMEFNAAYVLRMREQSHRHSIQSPIPSGDAVRSR